MSKCFAKGCERSIPSHLLMCGEHWRMVPSNIQQEVYDANRTRIATGQRGRWTRAARKARESIA